ncbi:MAG: O-antigen ligase family protein [Clostridiales bacterium]|nr:O-antigen ligase family protein [Clostridiales bacterium]
MEYSRGKIINNIILLVLTIMPFILMDSKSPLLDGKYYFMLITGIILLILSLKIEKINIKIIDITALLFILSIFISSVFSPDKFTAFWGSANRGEGFFTILIYVILFFLSSKYLDINEKTLDIILISSCIMALHGILQFFGFDIVQIIYPLYNNLASDAIGTIGNRNFFSSYICIFLFLGMGLYIFKGNKKYLVYSSILFAALLCSLTRSGWLAFIIYSILGLLFILKRKDALKRSAIIILLFTVIFGVLNISTDNSIINRSNKNQVISSQGLLVGSVGGRAEILRMSFKAFCDRPLLGYGPDTLEMRLSEDYTEDFIKYKLAHGVYVDKSHNEFLEYAVSCGVFTLIFYLVLLGLIVYGLFKNKEKDINKILLITIIGYLVQSFFNISMIAVAPIFWILLGVSYKNIKTNKKEMLQ